jgi:cytochrome c2
MIERLIGRVLASALLLGAMGAVSMPAYADGDAVKGKKAFRACRACHQIGPKARNGVGPNLTGVVGRAIGSLDGYKYDGGLKADNAAGGVWDEAKIIEWLASPKKYIRTIAGDDGAKTKMTFSLKNETKRKDIAAFLAMFSKSEK